MPLVKEKELGQDGYYANWTGMRRGGEDARAEAGYIAGVRDRLRAALDAVHDPMGSDQYGAELAKVYPSRKKEIYDLFASYIDDLDGVSDGLVNGAKVYESAERPEG